LFSKAVRSLLTLNGKITFFHLSTEKKMCLKALLQPVPGAQKFLAAKYACSTKYWYL
jgi:hypothetical protein